MANKNIGNSELEELLEEGLGEYQSPYIKTVRQQMVYHQVSLDEPISEPSKYRDIINLLYMADENVEFNIFINSPGGSLMSAMAIIEAIKATNGDVRGIITGEAHSAGSMIALSCPEIVVTDSAHMLIHTCSYGTVGQSGSIQSHVDFSTKMIHRILDDIYSGFLTKEELIEVKKGVEFWFDAPEIRKRLLKMKDFIAKKPKVDHSKNDFTEILLEANKKAKEAPAAKKTTKSVK
jgi:ATP-dependent protease ClpP protease subunit